MAQHDVAERVGVHVSFEQATKVLRPDPRAVIEPASHELRLAIGAGAVTQQVVLSLGTWEIGEDEARIAVAWRAQHHEQLFPVLEGELLLTRRGWTDVELRLVGSYTPPLGRTGALGDRLLGHRVAERTIREFLESIATRLRTQAAEAAEIGLGRAALPGGAPASRYRDERNRK